MMTDKKVKCVALFSGGLDSSLAVLLMLQQNIEVTALMFLTHFGCDITDKSSCSQDPEPMSKKFGFTVKMMHLGEKFLDIVKKPKFGHGKNMNPCIDCRILMLKEAKIFMEMTGSDFLITGEVLGQRPMSQMRNTLRMIEKAADVEGILLRPLCAKLMEPTIAENEGLVDREQLMDMNGRSRKPQMALAEKYGLEDYPSPAAGCLLTDPGYSKRLKDLLRYQDDVNFNDLNLLRVGRHFRYNPHTKLIVGRNETENDKIESYREKNDILMEAKSTGSPMVLLQGPESDDAIEFAARLTARYCDMKNDPEVEITISNQSGERIIIVAPFVGEEVAEYRL
jgi:tRNA-uridine 2-sulfurtransferase